MKWKTTMPILLPLLAVSFNAAAHTIMAEVLPRLPAPDKLSYMIVLAPVVLTFVGLFLRKEAAKEHKRHQNQSQHQHI